MKTGRTLPELAAELERQANAKRDFLAPARSLKVESNGHTDLKVNAPYTLNDTAHGQLAEYLSVPKGFYDRLRNGTDTLRVPVDPYENAASDAPLFDVAVNTLLKHKGEDGRLIRTLDGKARAFLSDSFSLEMDNFDVFVVAARVILEA